MGKRYSLFVLVLLLLVIAGRILSMPASSAVSAPMTVGEHSILARGSAGGVNLDRRQALVEWSDRAVRLLKYSRSVSGHFPSQLAAANVYLPPDLQSIYFAELADSSVDHFRLVLDSKLETQWSEHFSIDQDFHVTSNFTIPSPRPEYLKQFAEMHLQEMASANPGHFPSESGLYAGFFRYQIEPQAEGRWVAIGIQSPVLGVRVESIPSSEISLGSPSAPNGLSLGEQGSWRSPGAGAELSVRDLGKFGVLSEDRRDLQGLRTLAALASAGETDPDHAAEPPAGLPSARSPASTGMARRVAPASTPAKLGRFHHRTLDGLEIESIGD